MGRNLLGEELTSRRGWDVDLEAQDGAKLSPDGYYVTAEREGLARLERLEQTIRRHGKIERVPAKIIASVESLHTVEGNDILHLEWNGHLEIQGHVLPGSKVRASGAILVHGDIEKNCEISAQDSIHIDGTIYGSLVESDAHIAAGAVSSNAQVNAAQKVLIHGVVEDSSIKAQDIHAGGVRNSKIYALRQAVVENEGYSRRDSSDIVVNLREFLALQQLESTATVQKAGETMQRLAQLFGQEAIRAVNNTSIQKILHQFLREQKRRGMPPYSPHEIENLRSILELVPAFRDLLADTGQELQQVTNQIAQQGDQELVLVREPVVSSSESKSD
jgi:uncharacterized protein (DUF342 family)